jgi:hypothetical protein
LEAGSEEIQRASPSQTPFSTSATGHEAQNKLLFAHSRREIETIETVLQLSPICGAKSGRNPNHTSTHVLCAGLTKGVGRKGTRARREALEIKGTSKPAEPLEKLGQNNYLGAKD